MEEVLVFPVRKGLGKGATMVANKDNILYSRVTERLTERKIGITVLGHATRGKTTMSTRVRGTKKATVTITTSILSHRSLRGTERRIVDRFNEISVLVGNTNKGRPSTVASMRARGIRPSSRGSFFSVSRENFSRMFTDGFAKAFLTDRIFNGRLLGRRSPVVVGVSSVDSCSPVAGIPTCDTTGSTVGGFAV